MNTKINKGLPVFLAVVTVLAISTFQVFAHNPSENEGFAQRSSATATVVVDDHGVDAPGSNVGEDTTFSGTVQALTATSITIDGKVIALAAGTRLDSGVVVGSLVKVEVVTQADGTLLAKEVETETETEHLNGDDHGAKTGGSDDKSGTSITGSGTGSSSGSIDDHGGNSGSSGSQGGSSSVGDDHGGKGK